MKKFIPILLIIPIYGYCGPLDDLTTPIKIALVLTVIPLIPFLLISLTCFTRIIIVFSLLRTALATRNVPPNPVLIGLALFMSFYIMRPTFTQIWNNSIVPYFEGRIGAEEAIKELESPLRKFLLKNVREEDLALFVHFSGQEKPKNVGEVPTSTIIPAFIISELKTSFQMGFLIFLPFLIIDMVLASVLLSMGMFMLPPMMVSLPLKLLLFVLVDGWGLLVETLVTSFR